METSCALDRALIEAEEIIARAPVSGLLAPRSYPGLAAPRERWVFVDAYWVAYRVDAPPVILGVFDDRADMAGRYES